LVICAWIICCWARGIFGCFTPDGSGPKMLLPNDRITQRLRSVENYPISIRYRLQKRPVSIGFSVQFPSDSPSTLLRIQRPLSFGLGVQFRSEYAIVYWVAVYIKHELSYDRFHRNSERVVRITSIERSAGYSTEYAYAPLPLANALGGLADVEATVTINGAKPLLLRTEDDAYYQDGVVTASSNLYSIFDFELLRGDRERVLSRPFTLVTTGRTSSSIMPIPPYSIFSR